MHGCTVITYHHILFEAHQIIFAQGAPTESFYPGRQALGALAPEMRAEIGALVPDLLRMGADTAYGTTARDFTAARHLPEHQSILARARG